MRDVLKIVAALVTLLLALAVGIVAVVLPQWITIGSDFGSGRIGLWSLCIPGTNLCGPANRDVVVAALFVLGDRAPGSPESHYNLFNASRIMLVVALALTLVPILLVVAQLFVGFRRKLMAATIASLILVMILALFAPIFMGIVFASTNINSVPGYTSINLGAGWILSIVYLGLLLICAVFLIGAAVRYQKPDNQPEYRTETTAATATYAAGAKPPLPPGRGVSAANASSTIAAESKATPYQMPESSVSAARYPLPTGPAVTRIQPTYGSHIPPNIPAATGLPPMQAAPQRNISVASAPNVLPTNTQDLTSTTISTQRAPSAASMPTPSLYTSPEQSYRTPPYAVSIPVAPAREPLPPAVLSPPPVAPYGTGV